MRHNMKNTSDAIASGLNAQQWVELLKGDKARFAKKALNYFDGQQEGEVEKLLSDPYKGRRNWKTRGIIPRYRNLTRMIVEKSAQLFIGQAPSFEVYQNNSDTIDENETQYFSDEMYKTEWYEFFINVDAVVRLLKTAIVLQQYNDIDGRVELELLHRGNCAAITNPINRSIQAMIYITSEYEGVNTYRIITETEYIDLTEIVKDGKSTISVSEAVPNPYGMVPATVFYDTTLPRSGIWQEAPRDLVSVNELVNLHITDSEYAISWAKLPTLFTIDCDVIGGGSSMEVMEVEGSALPRQMPADQSSTGGPSRSVALMSNGQGTPSVQYLRPDVNLEPLDKVVDGWIKAFASDWSVRIKTAGEGSASSGFQLVVEEMPNLELRMQRQRMFESAFKRFYSVFKVVMGNATGATFKPNTILVVEFTEPHLPTDTKQQEEVWDARINGGRASIIDYLMETQGMTQDEAEVKMVEIAAYNKGSTNQAPVDPIEEQPLLEE